MCEANCTMPLTCLLTLGKVEEIVNTDENEENDGGQDVTRNSRTESGTAKRRRGRTERGEGGTAERRRTRADKRGD